MREVLAVLLFAVLLACAGCASQPATSVPQFPRNEVKFLKGTDGDCSGVVIAPGTILTAKHCVGIGDVTVDGKPASFERTDPASDLALLKFDGGCPCAHFGPAPKIDDEVLVIGYPYGSILGPTNVVTRGTVHGTVDKGELSERFGHTFVLTAPASPGNSGGGVFALHGDRWLLVGILVAGAGSTTLAVDTPSIFRFIGV